METIQGPSLGELAVETQWEILLLLKPKDMISLCRVNKQFDFVCSADDLWREKTRIDFGVATKPTSMGWKEFYIALYEGKVRTTNVFFRRKPVGSIAFRGDESFDEIAKVVAPLVPGIDIKNIGVTYKPYSRGDRIIDSPYSKGAPKIFNTYLVGSVEGIEVSDREIAPLTLVVGSGFSGFWHQYWIDSNTTLGEISDIVRSIKPGATLITFPGSRGRPDTSFRFSDDPGLRSQNAFDFINENRIYLYIPTGIV